MKPENVNPNNFKVLYVLYNNNDFSIAYGIWTESGDNCIAMRWNGNSDDVGYPKTFGHPMWFIVDNELKLTVIKSLIGQNKSNKENLIKVLTEEYK